MKIKLCLIAVLVFAFIALVSSCRKDREMEINKLCATAANYGYSAAERGLTRREMLTELQDALIRDQRNR